MVAVKAPAWQPIDLELVIDGFLARVTRTLHGGRWRWSATPLEVAQRWRSSVVEHAHARGYSKSRERAQKMAEAAIRALKEATEA